METWQELLRKQSIVSLEAASPALRARTHVREIDRLREAADNFEFRHIPGDGGSDPDARRSDLAPVRSDRPGARGARRAGRLAEEDANSPVPNITHRYPDRALFLVSPVCAAYCRFCTRRRKVRRPREDLRCRSSSRHSVTSREHPEIRDVIMSGGDPLLLSDRRHRRNLQATACDSASGDPANRQPGALSPPERITPELVRNIEAIPPALHQHALQSP